MTVTQPYKQRKPRCLLICSFLFQKGCPNVPGVQRGLVDELRQALASKDWQEDRKLDAVFIGVHRILSNIWCFGKDLWVCKHRKPAKYIVSQPPRNNASAIDPRHSSHRRNVLFNLSTSCNTCESRPWIARLIGMRSYALDEVLAAKLILSSFMMLHVYLNRLQFWAKPVRQKFLQRTSIACSRRSWSSDVLEAVLVSFGVSPEALSLVQKRSCFYLVYFPDVCLKFSLFLLNVSVLVYPVFFHVFQERMQLP